MTLGMLPTVSAFALLTDTIFFGLFVAPCNTYTLPQAHRTPDGWLRDHIPSHPLPPTLWLFKTPTVQVYLYKLERFIVRTDKLG